MSAVSNSRAPPPPSRAWIFTWNNYPGNAFELLSAQRNLIISINVGREVGASGTPHLQGHLVLKKPCRLSALVKLFPGVHFEVRRASEAAAIEYTEKEGDPDRLDWDDRQQGARSDLSAVAAIISANPRVGLRAVASQLPTMFLKFHSGVNALSRALLPLPPMFSPRNVKWFFGPSGTGKSFTALQEAMALAPEDNIFRWTIQNLKFAGDYAGQQFVIIDELRTTWEHFTFARLLTLLDAYRCEVEVKGGQVPWCATHIWVTTPLHPHDFITDDERRGNPQAVTQLTRRIATVGEFNVVHPSAQAVPFCPDSAPPSPRASVASSRAPSPPPLVTTPPLAAATAFAIQPDSESSDSDAVRSRLLQRRLGQLPHMSVRLPARVTAYTPPVIDMS